MTPEPAHAIRGVQLTPKTRTIFEGILQRKIQNIINSVDGSSWKMTINCSGKSIKLSIEQFWNLP